MCKNCGQEFTNDMRFCCNCGCPVDKPHFTNNASNINDVILVTTSFVPNHQIVSFYGAVVATWVGIAAKRSGLFEAIDALSGKLGGDSYLSGIEEECYTKASERLKDVARSINCNAIIGLRYNSLHTEGAIQVSAYGTACLVIKNDKTNNMTYEM